MFGGSVGFCEAGATADISTSLGMTGFGVRGVRLRTPAPTPVWRRRSRLDAKFCLNRIRDCVGMTPHGALVFGFDHHAGERLSA